MEDDRDLQMLRESAAAGNVQWHQHALERMLERRIRRTEVLSAVMAGDVIEQYPADRPYPSHLIMGTEGAPLHVVAAVDAAAGTCHIVTVYRPDLEHFEPDMKTRRKKT